MALGPDDGATAVVAPPPVGLRPATPTVHRLDEVSAPPAIPGIERASLVWLAEVRHHDGGPASQGFPPDLLDQGQPVHLRHVGVNLEPGKPERLPERLLELLNGFPGLSDSTGLKRQEVSILPECARLVELCNKDRQPLQVAPPASPLGLIPPNHTVK